MNQWSTGRCLLLLQFCITVTVKADFHLGFTPREFSNPTNTLSNGTCCEPDCSECTVTLRFCFRESGHPHSDVTSPCSLLQFNRNTLSTLSVFGTDRPPIQQNYTGSFQVYIRASHHSEPDEDAHFDPPYTDPLIDNIFIEVTNLPAGSFENRNSLTAIQYGETGEFGKASVQIRIKAHCANGYNGSDCSTFCQELAGTLVCEEVTYDTPTTQVPTTVSDTQTTTDQETTTEEQTSPPTTLFSEQTTATKPSTTILSNEQTTFDDSELNDNRILSIAVGVSVGGGTVVLFLFIGVIISISFFIVKVWMRDPYKLKRKAQIDSELESQQPLTSESSAVLEMKETEDGSLK